MTDLTATSPYSCARPEASAPMPAALGHRVELGAVGLLDQPAPRGCVCAVGETRCGSLTTPPTSVQQPAEAGPIHSSVTASNPHTTPQQRPSAVRGVLRAQQGARVQRRSPKPDRRRL